MATDDPTGTTRFPFAFDALYRLPARLLGVHDGSASVEVDDERFEARFGRWRVLTTRANVARATVTGPYAAPKTIGPPHLSFTDRGLTFATNGRAGVCVRFHVPVRGLDPLGLLRHPALTVTVEDVEGLVEALQGDPFRTKDLAADRTAARAADRRAANGGGRTPSLLAVPAAGRGAVRAEEPTDEDAEREQAAVDRLHTMTARELRELADQRGVRHRSSLKKAELVELLEADLGRDLVEEVLPDQT